MKAYLKLSEKFERISHLRGATAILQWDNATTMPEGSHKSRGEQLATIGTICHEILTDAQTADLLLEAESKTDDLDEWQKSNLKLMRHEYAHATCVDSKLLAEFTKAGAHSEMIWRSAKPDNDFKKFAPFLQNVLNLSRQIASAKSEALGVSKYDALLDQFDDGRRSAEVDLVFNDLEQFLPNFLHTVLEKNSSLTKPKATPINGVFPIKNQKKLAHKLMLALGFDFDKGRLDTSSHPFCGGTPDDVRITCRYNKTDFTKSIMNVTHETGHALYEAGLPARYRSQPVGNALGMSMHESQSLFFEMQIARSHEFFSFLGPLITETLNFKSDAASPENLHQLSNQVRPSFIRVDADEVTYPLHIILRYKIEKALIEGKMEVADIPAEWNSLMQKYLGITPKTDTEGCLQDIHWSDGSFGYFPTYTLGALTAAQLFKAMKLENPDAMQQVKQGNFTNIISWLRSNIHSNGSLLSTNDLIEKVTGEPLNANIFKAHLRNRYLS
jgi:carboxypeptidase Taq